MSDNALLFPLFSQNNQYKKVAKLKKNEKWKKGVGLWLFLL